METYIIAGTLGAAALITAGTYAQHWLENRQFKEDLRWMVASLRCGSDTEVLLITQRWKHRKDLLAVIEQQIELVGIDWAWRSFQSHEWRPR